jgi:hypothetical protein
MTSLEMARRLRESQNANGAPWPGARGDHGVDFSFRDPCALCSRAMLAAALATTLLVTVTPVARPGAAARIVEQQARWTGLVGGSELAAETDDMFLISGQVRNDGRTPLRAVRLVYELTAEGVVVAREAGFNRRAEVLRDPAVESGAVAPATLAIAPLQPGESDLFRMIFLRGAVPHFDGWRVRIDRLLPAADDPPPATHGP